MGLTESPSHNWHFLRATCGSFLSTVDAMERRQAWTDERMDEFAQRTDENFREVRAEIKDEVQGLRTEMNGRFAALEAKLDRRFDILFGALATGFVAAVVQHFVG
jgi:hypothetical protein